MNNNNDDQMSNNNYNDDSGFTEEEFGAGRNEDKYEKPSNKKSAVPVDNKTEEKIVFDEDPIKYILETVSKEVKDDDKLVRQTLYTIFSSATKNPMNLAVNAPSGEGKSYVVNKVASLFSKEDVISLSGMTEKSLFHKRGTICVKQDGKFVSLRELTEPIYELLRPAQDAAEATKDPVKLKEINHAINGWKNEIEELENKAVKVIDLNNKVLIFMDTPHEKLFSELMPLMSHDEDETTYEFVDNNEGIKTNTNILKGFPSFIFTQAIDFSGYERADEIQRRFLISNPNMDAEKYNKAADLISLKFSVPDFVYQELVVSDKEKDKAASLATQILTQIKKLNENTKPNKNNVIIPFYQTVRDSLNITKGLDMTTTGRIFGCLSLLPVIKSYQRPKMVIKTPNEPDLIVPLATFDDLQETLYLMENSSGVRPFIMDWFEKVFMTTYKNKEEPDSKQKDKSYLVESRIAVTTEQLAAKHKAVYGKSIITKKVLQTYIYPLTNNGTIDSIKSEISGRSNIYFPINQDENILLFQNEERNILLRRFKLKVVNLISKPTKQYIISKINPYLKHSSQSSKNFSFFNHKDENVTVEELAELYYSKFDDYFTVDKALIEKERLMEEYLKSLQFLLDSQDITDDYIELTTKEIESSNKIFQIEKRNKRILLETVSPQSEAEQDEGFFSK